MRRDFSDHRIVSYYAYRNSQKHLITINFLL